MILKSECFVPFMIRSEAGPRFVLSSTNDILGTSPAARILYVTMSPTVIIFEGFFKSLSIFFVVSIRLPDKAVHAVSLGRPLIHQAGSISSNYLTFKAYFPGRVTPSLFAICDFAGSMMTTYPLQSDDSAMSYKSGIPALVQPVTFLHTFSAIFYLLFRFVLIVCIFRSWLFFFLFLLRLGFFPFSSLLLFVSFLI